MTARAEGGGAFGYDYLYTLAEARRWLRNDDTETYIARAEPAVREYTELVAAEANGDFRGASRSILLASQAEIYGQIADAKSKALLTLADDWALDDEATIARFLDALYYASAWDKKRVEAIDEGSSWNSTNPGYSYGAGYSVGSLAGRLALADGTAGSPDACDTLTSFPGDPARRAPGVQFDAIDFGAAIPACRALLAAAPDDARLGYLLGRVLWHEEGERYAGAVDALAASANAGYAAAFNNLAAYAEDLPETVADASLWNYSLRHGYTQRAVIAGFKRTYDFLLPHAQTAEQVQGLHWLAERAGALGDVDAQLILADLAGSSPSDEERAFHLEVAARLVEDRDPDRAVELREMIDPEIFVDASDRVEDGWEIERLEADAAKKRASRDAANAFFKS